MNGKSNKSMRRGRNNQRSLGDQKGSQTARAVSLLSSSCCPDRVRVKLLYTDQIREAGVTTVKTDYVYRLNSCFDPDFTGTGNQPVGYDVWSTFYDSYRVWSAKYTIRPYTAPSTSLATWCLVPLKTSTALATSAAVLARGGNEFGFLCNTGLNGMLAANPSTGVGALHTKTISMPRFFGVSTAQFAGDTNYTAAVSTNPSQVCFLHLAGFVDDGATSTAFNFLIDFEFEVEFYGRVPQSFSLESRLQRSIAMRDKRISDKKTRDSSIDSKVGLQQPPLLRHGPRPTQPQSGGGAEEPMPSFIMSDSSGL